MNFAVQLIDYVANPSIFKKSDDLIERFAKDHLVELGADADLFKDVQRKIAKLKEECYIVENPPSH